LKIEEESNLETLVATFETTGPSNTGDYNVVRIRSSRRRDKHISAFKVLLRTFVPKDGENYIMKTFINFTPLHMLL
jgi:hypothetical protein